MNEALATAAGIAVILVAIACGYKVGQRSVVVAVYPIQVLPPTIPPLSTSALLVMSYIVSS